MRNKRNKRAEERNAFEKEKEKGYSVAPYSQSAEYNLLRILLLLLLLLAFEFVWACCNASNFDMRNDFSIFTVHRTRTHCLYTWKHAEHGIHATERIYIYIYVTSWSKNDKKKNARAKKKNCEKNDGTRNDETKKNWNFRFGVSESWKTGVLNSE